MWKKSGQKEQSFPVSQNDGKSDNQSDAIMDFEDEGQADVPQSDPISRFSSDEEGRIHAPSRNGKRPFEEVNLDLKAREHGSPEDQKRRDVSHESS